MRPCQVDSGAGVHVHYDWITPRVALGSRPASAWDVRELALEGVTHVVNMAAGLDLGQILVEASAGGLDPVPAVAAFPIGDAEDGAGVRGHLLRQAVAHVVRVLGQAEEHRVYVHCVHGVSRSATVVLGWLMHDQDIGVGEALARLKAARPKASPHPLLVAEMLDAPAV
ncbi:MAG: dual specificity protein phosphatase family protein [Candidatus Sericytochromatia bacterium]|nr:dual specificity protein phosphatase family protein [Candidatus Tanganyikabacteria bacterium]